MVPRLDVLLVVITVASTLPSATAVRAELRPLDDGRARIGQPSWADVGVPARREARLLLRQGVLLLLASSDTDDDGIEPATQVRVEQALARFDRALGALPDDPELAFYRGVALARFVREEASGRVERRTDEAVRELDRVRHLDPSYEPAAVAWHLALLHTRAGRHLEAASEYERVRALLRLPAVPIARPSRREEALHALFAVPEPELVDLNLAEVVMLAGDPSRASALYDAAARGAERGSLLSALALFGRALAEERGGRHDLALASALAATVAWAPPADDLVVRELVSRHGATAALHVPGVTFEPRCELHAYEALAHEARAQAMQAGRLPGGSEAAEATFERARRSLRAFFAVGGEGSRFRDVAERAVQRLDAGRAASERAGARAR
jgi:tetratricopeptide (TPR) repeat protein